MKPFKHLVQDKTDFNLLLDYLYDSEIFAYDTETNGKFSQYEVQLVGMSFGFTAPDFAVYLPLLHNTGKQLPISYVLDGLRELFEDPAREYVAHNAKFDEMVLGVHGIDCVGIAHDTMIMAWLLQVKRESKGLKQQVKKRFGVSMEAYEDVVKAAPRKRGVPYDFNFARVDASAALSYAADDAYYTLRLYEYFKPILERQKLWQAYMRIERPLVRVVGEMERRGVCIDLAYIEEANEKFPAIKEDIEGDIYEQAGSVFNINASGQVGKVLVEDLKIATPEEIPKTEKGKLSFDKNTMKMLKNRHPIVKDILRVKKLVKTQGTFVEGIMEKIEKDGRVHPSFNQTGTETGRFSCNNPNLQQIEGDEVEGIKIRNFFVAGEGMVFVGGDYSQIELRILAHLSEDQNMIDAFLSGMDFHDATARKMLEMQGNPISLDTEVLPRQRFHAKSLNFGIPYGRGPGSVAEMLDVIDFCAFWPQPVRDKSGELVYNQLGKTTWGYGHWGRKKKDDDPCHECGKCFIEDWFATFPLVRELKDRTIAEARARGYVRTLAGRKRRLLPEIRSGNPVLRSSAERQAFNTIIQGSAADIIKLAMVALAPKLKPFKAKMVLTIHDELIVESPQAVAEDVRQVMQETMSFPLNGKNPLCLPLKTDPQIGMKWGEVK